MRVKLVTPNAADGTQYASLTLGAEYEVLGIEGNWLRLVNDRGEPVLYDPACFQVADAAEPEDWVSVVEGGVRYAYPPSWGQPGFFEDWHDGVPEVRQQFSQELARPASKARLTGHSGHYAAVECGMSDEDALLAAIAEHPAEDTPRLMYADWLDEHSEHIRAEFIRVQIEIARAEQLSQVEKSRAAPAYVRERVLSAVYRAELLGPLAPAERAVDVYFHRGFISLVRMSVEVFLTHSHLLAQLRPLPGVRVTGVGGRLTEFLRHPCLNLVSEIVAYPAYRAAHGEIPDEALVVAGGNRLTRLAVLYLDDCGVGNWFCAGLGNFRLPALEVLSLARTAISDSGVLDLLESEHPRKLRRLILSGNAIGDDGAIAMAERWPRGAADRLEYLGLRGTAVSFDGRDALVARFGGRVEVSMAEW